MAQENIGQYPKFLELAGDIVAAYVSNNSVPVSELPNFIQKVHQAILGLSSGSVPNVADQTAEIEKPTPAQIRKSVQHDGIVSFIDGRTYKTLKRHLTANGFSPHSYCERYGLPADYPMVAPGYAEKRSALAKSFGLGQPGFMTGRARKARKAA
ncbi:MucR family transcriptional regulator [Methylobacterium sp. J-077]|uniref:MucR family transcriptional regulator n=1 Tax=Methylobacterium sp. J-077 TaxID=2836656 RepID=UPI001FBAC2CF|nr:MucR family transcriptional regulator [Methylobacterium sp. J-077]MCJ2124942.1 MucR family transcriptional regulator [Methylobacterium sp. J-077]